MKKATTRRSDVGNIRQTPSGKWQARVTSGRRVDGKPRTVSKTFADKSEAQAWIMAQSVEMRANPNVARGITLAALWKVYEANRLPELAATTQKVYRQHMSHVVESIGAMDASSITHADIQRILDGMRPSMARKTATVLSAVLTYAVRHGLLGANVMYRAPFDFGACSSDSDDSEIWDTDPFAAVEVSGDVWTMRDALRCADAMRGLALEPAYLCCVGAGLRVEEAMAIRKVDVRRIVGSYDEYGRELWITQLAVHHATTREDRRKSTKTAHSVGVVPMLEPFGARLWEIACNMEDAREPLCGISAARQNKTWRSYFEKPCEYHKRMADSRKVQGALWSLHLPYLPLSRMRATHTTYVQQQGLADSLNVAWHRNSSAVQQKHYMSPDLTDAAAQLSRNIV